MLHEQIRRDIIDAALKLKEYQLISLCGGNVSVRLPDNTILMTPSGMEYETMEPGDICYLNADGIIIESKYRPSSDKDAIIYVFDHMHEINAVIHTHQPYATALGLVDDYFPPCVVTQIDALKGGVHVAPFTLSSDRGMGVLTVEYAGGSLAVILKNHGIMALGPSLKTCLYSAVYLEEAAKTYMIARAVGKVEELPAEMVKKEARDIDTWVRYHQKKKA